MQHISFFLVRIFSAEAEIKIINKVVGEVEDKGQIQESSGLVTCVKMIWRMSVEWFLIF